MWLDLVENSCDSDISSLSICLKRVLILTLFLFCKCVYFFNKNPHSIFTNIGC